MLGRHSKRLFFTKMMALKVAVLLVVVAVSTANVAPGSALTKVSSAKMVTKVADLTERKVVTTVAAAKKAVPAPATPNYTETLKMAGLFALWYVVQLLYFPIEYSSKTKKNLYGGVWVAVGGCWAFYCTGWPPQLTSPLP